MKRENKTLGEPVTAIATAVIMAVNFVIANLDKDDDLMAARDRVLNIFRRFGLNESIWNRYLEQFQLTHSQVKNFKLFNKSGYKEEWKRLYDMVFKMLEDHFPYSFNPFLEQTQSAVPIDVALDYALTNPDIPVTQIISSRPAIIITGALAVLGILFWTFSD